MRRLRIEMNKHAGEACCCRGLPEFIINRCVPQLQHEIRYPRSELGAGQKKMPLHGPGKGCGVKIEIERKPGVSVTGPLTPVIHRG
jgi:hypothetical protein